jgi:hypothetical protein
MSGYSRTCNDNLHGSVISSSFLSPISRSSSPRHRWPPFSLLPLFLVSRTHDFASTLSFQAAFVPCHPWLMASPCHHGGARKALEIMGPVLTRFSTRLERQRMERSIKSALHLQPLQLQADMHKRIATAHQKLVAPL